METNVLSQKEGTLKELDSIKLYLERQKIFIQLEISGKKRHEQNLSLFFFAHGLAGNRPIISGLDHTKAAEEVIKQEFAPLEALLVDLISLLELVNTAIELRNQISQAAVVVTY